MAIPHKRRTFSADEYLRLERDAETRSEFWAGEIFALAGASEKHNLIVTNLVITLGTQLRGKPCTLYANALRVEIQSKYHYTYPDVVVVCGETKFADNEQDTLQNPTLFIEVLSPSTASYDRGDKFESYRTLPSLKTYLLIAQDRCHVERFERQGDGRWMLSEYKGLEDTVTLETIGCELELLEVYDKVLSNS